MGYLTQLGAIATALLASATPSSASSAELTAAKNVICACRKLSNLLPKDIIYPGSANYTQEATNDFWDIRTALSPSCIVVPRSADEVATAIEAISSCHAPFAVRGGGHMNIVGSNNINNGVLIGLTNLNQVKVNADTVEVGPALTWYDVYSALEPYGRVAIGGRLKTIGVPGLTLIGGYHYFNNKYGFAMDNVDSYDVVLGNGTQVTATRSSHPDLFWALKGGGGNNFGVVTKFVLKTYPVPQVSTTIQAFNESAVPGFLAAVCEAAKLNSADPIAAGMVATVSYNVSTQVTSASLLGVQEGVSNPPDQFANFSRISTFALNNVTNMKDWAFQFDTPKQGFRIQFAHRTIKADAAVLTSLYESWKKSLSEVIDVEGLGPTFVANVISPTSVRVGNNNGVGNIWGLPEEPLIIWQFSTSWSLARDDKRMQNWAKTTVERLHRENRRKGIASEYVYMGDAGDWQDAFAGVPKANVARLKRIQAAYDRDRVFSRLSTGGFKF
ncbi:FAD-binding oxidoreductase [Aspergillus ustus]|uniref:FAD-binding oxidoreductase n=1 Tax=Aspergillus ustus TaxID=40382 RepID=A0A0C1BUY5_ASPUT|nr:FAD-binding oxidoreductase [Aspergillus ustus]